MGGLVYGGADVFDRDDRFHRVDHLQATTRAGGVEGSEVPSETTKVLTRPLRRGVERSGPSRSRPVQMGVRPAYPHRSDLDRFHLVIDVIDRVPGLGAAAGHLRQRMVDERRRARAYTRAHGKDDPAITDWTWPYGAGSPA